MMIGGGETQNALQHRKSISLKLHSASNQIPPSGRVVLLKQEEHIVFLLSICGL